MTVIRPFAAGTAIAGQATQRLVDTRAKLEDLQRQLAEGRRAETYGGLGIDRRTSLDARAKLSQLAGFDRNITSAKLRLDLLSKSVDGMDRTASDTRRELATRAYAPDNPTRLPMRTIAEQRLAATIDQLNTDLDGRFLFAGRASDTRPVASLGAIFDGEPGRLGLRALVDERQRFHGATGEPGATGRIGLAAGVPANAIAISQAASMPQIPAFGLRIDALTSTSGFASLSADLDTLTIATQPNAGDALTLTIADAFGGTQTLTLGARASGSSDATGFVLGANVEATAANVQQALGAALRDLARDALAPRVAAEVVAEFYSDAPVRRPIGDPAVATALDAGDFDTQVRWYRGETAPGSARETAPVRIGESQIVALGARADEAPMRDLMTALTTLAIVEPRNSPSGVAAFAAIATEIGERLPADGTASLRGVAAQLGAAAPALAQASDRNRQAEMFLQNLLDEVEGISKEEVAAQILALQTRLEASYRTTAMMSRLSLVNFL